MWKTGKLVEGKNIFHFLISELPRPHRTCCAQITIEWQWKCRKCHWHDFHLLGGQNLGGWRKLACVGGSVTYFPANLCQLQRFLSADKRLTKSLHEIERFMKLLKCGKFVRGWNKTKSCWRLQMFSWTFGITN